MARRFIAALVSIAVALVATVPAFAQTLLSLEIPITANLGASGAR